MNKKHMALATLLFAFAGAKAEGDFVPPKAPSDYGFSATYQHGKKYKLVSALAAVTLVVIGYALRAVTSDDNAAVEDADIE